MGQAEDTYHFQDGPYRRNMTPEAYIEYLRILNEVKYSKAAPFMIKRKEWLSTDDDFVDQENIMYLDGKKFYHALFINGVTDHALGIACKSAKDYLLNCIR